MTPTTNSTPLVIQRTLSTSVKPSWLIHRYLVHTSEARTSSTTRAPMASAVMPSGDRRRREAPLESGDRKSTRLNSSHVAISYAVFCLKKKTVGEADV